MELIASVLSVAEIEPVFDFSNNSLLQILLNAGNFMLHSFGWALDLANFVRTLNVL